MRPLSFTLVLTVGAAVAPFATSHASAETAPSPTLSLSPTSPGAAVQNTTAPEITIEAPSSPSQDRAPVWGVRSEVGATMRCALDGDVPALCGPSFVGDLSEAVDGPHTVTVVATDALGNQSTVMSEPYVLDTTPPAAPSVDGSQGEGTDARSTWNILAEPGAGLACRLLTDGASGTPFPCSSPVGITLPSSGTYGLRVTQTDTAGNESPAADSVPYILSTEIPDRPVVTGPRGPAQLRSPVWQIQAATGASVHCRLMRDGNLVDEVQPCGSTVSFALDSDGSYVVEAVVVGDSGLAPAAVGISLPYVLDTVSPVVRGVHLASPRERDDERSLTWVFTAEQPDTSRLRCTLTYEGALPADQPRPATFSGPCASSPVTVVLDPDLPDGTYRFGVTETDAAGNVGAPTTATYVLDTTPPALPIFTVEPLGPSSGPQVRWRVAPDSEAVSRVCSLFKDGTLVDTRDCEDTSYSRDLRPLGEGGYELAVTAIDDLGNATPASTSRRYTYNAAAGQLVWDSYPGSTLPVPFAEPGQTGSLGYAPTATPFIFHSEDGASFHCRLTRGPQQDAAEPVAERACDGAGPGTGRFVLGDDNASIGGTYWLTVTVSQPGRQEVGVSVVSFVLDLTPPGAPVFTSGAGYASDDQPVFTWQAPPSEGTEQHLALCRLVPVAGTAGPLTPCSEDGGQGSYAPRLPGAGTWTLEVRYVDRAGRQGPSATSPAYTYDPGSLDRPVVQGPTNGLVGVHGPVNWFFQPPPDVVQVICRLTRDEVDLVEETACPQQGYTRDLQGQPPGTYELTVTYKSGTGTRSYAASRYFYVRADPPPVSDPRPRAGSDLPATTPRTAAAGTTSPVDPAQPPPVVLRRVPVLRPVPAEVGPAQPRSVEPSVVDQDTGLVSPGRPERVSVPGVPGDMRRAVPGLVAGTVTRPTLPLALVGLVVLFLMVQNRIDRREPKLFGAPLALEPDLAFGPPLRAPSPRPTRIAHAEQEPG